MKTDEDLNKLTVGSRLDIDWRGQRLTRTNINHFDSTKVSNSDVGDQGCTVGGSDGWNGRHGTSHNDQREREREREREMWWSRVTFNDPLHWDRLVFTTQRCDTGRGDGTKTVGDFLGTNVHRNWIFGRTRR